MLEIWDEATGALLADGLEDLAEATERLEELLAETRRLVERTGDGAEGVRLEWSVRDAEGRVVAGHSGAPVPWPES